MLTRARNKILKTKILQADWRSMSLKNFKAEFDMLALNFMKKAKMTVEMEVTLGVMDDKKSKCRKVRIKSELH